MNPLTSAAICIHLLSTSSIALKPIVLSAASGSERPCCVALLAAGTDHDVHVSAALLGTSREKRRQH
jgi:hypothetical protein